MTATPRTPHAPTVSRLLNRQPEFWRSPRAGERGFAVEQVTRDTEHWHGGPVTISWSEGWNPPTDQRTFPEPRAYVERKKKAEMRAFLEGLRFAVFTAPAGHLVLLTPEGAAATATASARADDLLGTAHQILAVSTTGLAGERRTDIRHISRDRAHAELVLALRYRADDVSQENGSAVIGDDFSRTEYRRLGGEAAGDGPYALRTVLGDGVPISRHATRESAQEAGRGYAGALVGSAGSPESWRWKPRDESRWAGKDLFEWELTGEESTGFVVRGPRTEPPRTRSEVRDVPHRLIVDGAQRHAALSPAWIASRVRNARLHGAGMEQEPDGTVRIESRRYEPLRVREVTATQSHLSWLPEKFAALYDVYRGSRCEGHESGRTVRLRLKVFAGTSSSARVWVEEGDDAFPTLYTVVPFVEDVIVYRPQQEAETASVDEAVRAGTHLVRDTGRTADDVKVYECPECRSSGDLVSFVDRPCTEEMEQERAAEYADSMRRVYLEAARTLLGMARVGVVPDGGEGSGVRLYPVAGARAVRVVTVLDGKEHAGLPALRWTEESEAERAQWFRYWGDARQTLRDGGWRHATETSPVMFEAPDGIENEQGQPVRFAGHRLSTTPETVEAPTGGGVKSVEGFRCVDCGTGCFLEGFADLPCAPPTAAEIRELGRGPSAEG
ncbi:hypothetical protein [Streptomyces sp. NPDC058595]|uniref:hypothetical protein n=1 Tax=Streptomyces sp. NPDC058595 TaxID=3346550 RepID=UPI00364FC8D1